MSAVAVFGECVRSASKIINAECKWKAPNYNVNEAH